MKAFKIYKILILVFQIGILSACASSSLKVESSPSESSVDIIYKNGSRKTLGNTPLVVSSSELPMGEESYLVQVSKVGFEKSEVFVPGSTRSRKVELNVSLNPQNNFGQAQAEKDLNTVATSVAEVQRQIQARQFELASARLAKLIADYPKVGVFYSLLGNVHYLNRNISQAVVYYKKALDFDPNSIEIKKMVEKLNGLSQGAQ